jgi:hypothetical protein
LGSNRDLCYSRSGCGKYLRYNAGTKTVLEVRSCDSSVDSVVSWKEHICSAKSQKRPAENYLQAQQREKELQQEYYGGFHSSGQLSNTPTSTYRKRQSSPPQKTEQHKQNISTGIRARFNDRTAIREMKIRDLLERGIKNKTGIARVVGTSWITVRNTVKQLEGKSKN